MTDVLPVLLQSLLRVVLIRELDKRLPRTATLVVRSHENTIPSDIQAYKTIIVFVYTLLRSYNGG